MGGGGDGGWVIEGGGFECVVYGKGYGGEVEGRGRCERKMGLEWRYRSIIHSSFVSYAELSFGMKTDA